MKTTNGCIMTSKFVLEIAWSKRAADVAKRRTERSRKRQRARVASVRLCFHQQDAVGFCSDQDRVTTSLSDMYVDVIRAQPHSMGLKRAIARHRTLMQKHSL